MISNFSSLVLGYGDYRGGKYEFGFTNIHEGALPPEEFVLRLLYILTLSPEKAFDHAAQTRSTDMGATTEKANNNQSFKKIQLFEECGSNNMQPLQQELQGTAIST